MRLIDADAVHATILQAFSDGHDDPTGKLLGDLIDEAPTITPPPNAPLTLEELQEMEGEPVFLKRPGYCDRWALVKVSTETLNVYFILVDGIEDETFISAEIEIKNGCKVYCRKPEEETR